MDQVKDVQDIIYSFHLPEVGSMHYYLFPVGRNCYFEMIFFLFTKSLKINEIGYYYNVIFDIKIFKCFIFKVLRYGRYSIRLIDRKSYRRFVSRIPPHEG